MKNIYVLPTEKPSRLFDDGIELYLGELKDRKGHPVTSYNIYIISDEEIKEGDWFYLDMSHSNTLPDEIHQMGNDKWSKTGGIHFCEGNTWVDSCKKIILTDNEDLIKDGVQAIDDEFLEWFIKNPSCEEVEISFACLEHRQCICKNNDVCLKRGYQIIIPKEEFNQDLTSKNYIPIFEKPNEMEMLEVPIPVYKQETIEEARANSYIDFAKSNKDVSAYSFVAGWDKSAKWQQERSYSEEEVLKLLIGKEENTKDSIKYNGVEYLTPEEWFEQFKKK